jgi:hypothetical protein
MLIGGVAAVVVALIVGGCITITQNRSTTSSPVLSPVPNGSDSTVALSGSASSGSDSTLSGLDGFSIDIPAGAVPLDRNGQPGEIVVSVDQVDAVADVDTTNLPPDVAVSKTAYQLGPEGQTFATPVTLTLPIARDMDASKVGGLAYLDTATRTWITVPGQVDESSGVVRASITHFSFWTMYQDSRSDMENWRETHGGWFDVTNNNMVLPQVFPFEFFGTARARNNRMVVEYGLCIVSKNLDDPNTAEASWYIPGDARFQVRASPNEPTSGGTRAFWLPAGNYEITEVWFASEINPGDPLYIPVWGVASRPLASPIRVDIASLHTVNSRHTLNEANVDLRLPGSIAAGWTTNRPACLGVVNPSLGGGDVQVTLNWPQTGVDLDLHVIDPNGDEIYYSNPTSPSGGALDWDNQNGGGTPENIFWSSGAAPKGTYTVSIVYYAGEQPADWSVRTVVHGQVETFSGKLSPSDAELHLTSFQVE